MADSRDLLVRILGDDRSLQSAFTRTERRTKQFDSQTRNVASGLSRAFGAVGISLSTAAVFSELSKSIDAASNLNEQISKSRQIFGQSSETIENWSKTTAEAFGISQAAALEATGTFGNLFRVVDIAPAAAGDMSRALVQLAADLASFNNASPEEVLTAIRSGLVGEAEPLRRYGVLLSEARVQQQALADTGKLTVSSLTAQEKTMARYSLILRDTAIAQGDFQRTQEGLANQTRILRANFDDLRATIGGQLVPAVNVLTTGLNTLFSEFGDDNAIDISITGNAEERIASIRERLDALGDGAIGVRIELQKTLDVLLALQSAEQSKRPDDAAGPRGPGAITASNAAVDARNAARDAKQSKRELEKARDAFRSFTKGLGLKLDRAGLTADLNDDLAVMREIEAAIRKRIAAEGRTFELVNQLTQVQLQIASTVERQQEDAQRKVDDATDRAVEKQRRATEERRDRQEREARRRERETQRRQGSQFEALGLTGTGSQRVPGVGALRRRLGNIRQAVEGTILDTAKTESQLDNIAKVLSGKFGKVGKDVREAILQMFNDISGALGQGDAKLGPLTKTSGLNTKKLLAGLGLSPEEVNELRGRLSSFNTGGRAPAGSGNQGTGGGFTGGTGFVVQSNVTVNIDGKKVASVVTKQQQKDRKRNPVQKRGPNRSRSQ